jgi:hypothetical protein
MPKEDISTAGIPYRFSSTNQPSNRGRKPSKLKAWIKDHNVSSDDFVALFTTIIATHTLEELEEMVNDENKPKLPVIIALCISAFLRDMKTGTMTSANTVLDRIMGKPTQQINLGRAGGTELPIDPEERRSLAERLRKELEIGSSQFDSELGEIKKAGSGKTIKKTKGKKI